ncbi:ACD11 homolog protein [Ziziphus jujuba]|uniref:ACD11 homolog protein n=2 Tax=Ziziphus jujuba TaxID=326968 RepID=A0A6P4AF98_ZIZJJ|nr:ACD11 homolog protein [Ziziphus jujuba]KAH7516547.1 hypothetical protein FEM48_Zijuj10G0146600 [Ziziphus jujuba var. spinosa]
MVVCAENNTAMEGGVAESFKDSASTPLSSIAEAFEELSRFLNNWKVDGSNEDMPLGKFCEACSRISILFSCLGIAFKFAELEYVSKVNDLMEASKTYNTLKNVIDYDAANDTVKTPGSHSRNLRRVRQGLDLIRALFEQFLSANDYSLRDAASAAYHQVCAPYHTWTVRTAVAAGMYTLPTKDQLLLRLRESNQSAEKKMKRYIEASHTVIEYIDELYLSRNIRLDW